jgi:hypothetical protein
MVDLTELLHLSPHSEEGFLEFERIARAEMDKQVKQIGLENAMVEYMSAVQAAFEEFGIEGAGKLGTPDNLLTQDDFNWFNQAVKRVTTRLQVRALRRTSVDLIELQPDDKTTLITEVGRLKNRVTKAVDRRSEEVPHQAA